jgi:hypothetical protein
VGLVEGRQRCGGELSPPCASAASRRAEPQHAASLREYSRRMSHADGLRGPGAASPAWWLGRESPADSWLGEPERYARRARRPGAQRPSTSPTENVTVPTLA